MNCKKPGKVSAAEIKVVALMACAVAFGQSWVMISFQSLNIYAGIDDSETVLDAIYLISIVCISLLLLTMGVFQRRAGKALCHRPLFWGSCVVMIVSSVLFSVATTPGPLGAGALVTAGIISAFSSGIMLVYQGMIISRMALRDVTVSVAVGMILTLFLFSFSIMLDPILAMVLDAMLALAYGVCLHFTDADLRACGRIDVVALDRQESIKNVDERNAVRELVMRLCLCVGLVGFIFELNRTVFIQIDIIDAGMVTYAALQTFGGIITTVGAVLVALAMMNARVQRMPFICHHFVFLFVIGAVLVFPLPTMLASHSTFVEYSIGQGAQSCFSLFMWILTAALCQRMSIMRVRIFCFIRCAWAIGPLIGLSIGRYVCSVAGISVLSLFAVTAVEIFAAVIAMAVVFNESALQNAMGIIPIERRERFQEKCRKVIEQYGLSEREGEIMTMFAKGRNLAFIQDELCISRSTVSTHRQHIYKKLDIHSQQELLDVVQNAKI